MTSPIALVLDPYFGARLARLSREMPVWIVSSEHNDAAVVQARRAPGSATSITTLLVGNSESAGDTCLRALYDIEDHHGELSSASPYDRVLVFGGTPDMLTPQAMQELGLSSVTESDFGFIVERPRRHAALPHTG